MIKKSDRKFIPKKWKLIKQQDVVQILYQKIVRMFFFFSSYQVEILKLKNFTRPIKRFLAISTYLHGCIRVQKSQKLILKF